MYRVPQAGLTLPAVAVGSSEWLGRTALRQCAQKAGYGSWRIGTGSRPASGVVFFNASRRSFNALNLGSAGIAFALVLY